MPPIETDDRHQRAVLWVKSGADDNNEPIFTTPEEIDVRWEFGRTERVDPNGDSIAWDAVAVVDRAIPVGSLLGLGTLEDVTGSAVDIELYQAIAKRETPDIKGRSTRRIVMMMRWKSSIPELTE